MKTYRVTSSDQLKAAYAVAGGGDRIELAPGEYGHVELRGRAFVTPLTITSQDPGDRAVFTRLINLTNTDGIRLENVDLVRDGMLGSGSTSLVLVKNSDRVTLSNLRVEGHVPTDAEGADPGDYGTVRGDIIAGYGHGLGIRVMGSDDFLLEDSEISQVDVALRIEDGQNNRILRNDIHDVREGIDFFDLRTFLIAENYIHDFKPFRAVRKDGDFSDHSDMMQFWGVASSFGLRDITIRDNVLYQPEGEKTQSIFGHLDLAPKHITAKGFQISGNLIINAQTNAIWLKEVSDVRIFDNLLVTNHPDPSGEIDYLKITLTQVKGAEVHGNVGPALPSGGLVKVAGGSSAIDIHDNLALSRDPGAADFYGRVLAAIIDDPRALMKDGKSFVSVVERILADDAPSPMPAPDEADARLEVGSLTVAQADATVWHSVRFDAAIDAARVVMSMGLDDGDPATLRVRNVTDQGFQFQIDEWDYLDGRHGTETVTWLAASAGTHRLADGTTISAGRVTLVDDIAGNVALDGHDGKLSAFAQVTSAAAPGAVTTRIGEVSSKGFSVRMTEEEAADQRHAAETVDWLVFERDGNGDLVDLHQASVNHVWSTLRGANDGDRAMLTGLQNAAGSDPVVLRVREAGDDLKLRLQEETSADSETWHYREDASVALLELGSHDLFG